MVKSNLIRFIIYVFITFGTEHILHIFIYMQYKIYYRVNTPEWQYMVYNDINQIILFCSIIISPELT